MIPEKTEKIKENNLPKSSRSIIGYLNDSRIKFLVVASLSYFVLFLIYEFILKKHTRFDEYFIRFIIENVDEILKKLHYKTFKTIDINDFQVIGIHGSIGVWVGGACNAISLFIVFSVFVAAFPGRQKNKWWFIPIGILTIHIINVLRVVGLAILTYINPAWLEFNHTYTFTFLVYAYIFLLWVWWVNKYA